MFCWFLREKRSNDGTALIPSQILSRVAAKQGHSSRNPGPLFFEVLNKRLRNREERFKAQILRPSLSERWTVRSRDVDDCYKFDKALQRSDAGKIEVPDDWLHKFFDLLETYNFTVDENTSFDIDLSIDPEMLGRIFENLLARINPETGQTVRKGTGSFYTPREIVEYMVDQSLSNYLVQATELSQERISALVNYDLTSDEQLTLTVAEKQDVLKALSEAKILDPACGSGAFPMGILQKIVFILQRVDPDAMQWLQKQLVGAGPELRRHLEEEFGNKNFDYLRKLGVIRESIYGVDIQPIATEISRLRCSLTLVVDQSVKDDAPNRGIEPLPNLDFKFVTANSLIKLPAAHTGQIDLFDDQEGIAELKEIRNQYFTASESERDQIRYRFAQVQKSMFQKMIAGNGIAELTQKLSAWDPFSHKTTDWFDSEWMFGIKQGFDIVIANPPYVSVKGLSAEVKSHLANQFETAQGRFNLFTLFIEKGITLLSKGGTMTFIIPEGLYSHIEYRHIRHYILKNADINLINQFSTRVFEASVDTSIISLSKRLHQLGDSFYVFRDLGDKTMELEQSEFLKLPNYLFPVNLLAKSATIIMRLLNGEFEPLGKIIEIQQGIIYSGVPRDEIFSNEKVNSSYKPVLDGRDILKWYINWDRKLSNKFIEYSDKLHRARDERLFTAKEKIVLPRRSLGISCSFDDQQYYALNTAYVCLPKNQDWNLKYLIGCLNSKLINFFYSNLYLGWQITIPALDSIPIVRADSSTQGQLAALVDEAAIHARAGDADALEKIERQIDQVVYRLYNLTSEEVSLIEGRGN